MKQYRENTFIPLKVIAALIGICLVGASCPEVAQTKATVTITVKGLKVGVSTASSVNSNIKLLNIPEEKNLEVKPNWDVYMFDNGDFRNTLSIESQKSLSIQKLATNAQGVATFELTEAKTFYFQCYYTINNIAKGAPDPVSVVISKNDIDKTISETLVLY